MSVQRELESTLFYFGFRECKKRKGLNFLKLSKQDYLIIKIFEKANIADLIHAKFSTESNPCEEDPYWEKMIKQGFSPDTDSHLIRNYLKLFE